jgi:hypothetical protein
MSTNPLKDRRHNGNGPVARLRGERHRDHACPPHAWGCPVVMKVDPRMVAWTCAGCGAIATVPVGAAPPPSVQPG